MEYNLSILEFMVELHQSLDVSTVKPSVKAKAELDLFMGKKAFKNIVGPRHIKMLKCSFEFTIGGRLRHEVVHPGHLHLFNQEAKPETELHLNR